jgi:putative ABC transport system permease protein
LRDGRMMTDHDTKATPLAVMVNETFARRYFPGGSPLGERLKFSGDYFDVVGVVGDVRQRGPEAEALPEMYISYQQRPMLWPRMDFVIRATSDPASLAAGVRRELQAVDPNQPVYNVQPMDRVVSASIAERGFNTLLLAAFSMLAMLLAAAGIYGLISFSVAERTREIGIRMALGAQSSDVMKLVTIQGMRLALIGVAIGLGISFASTRLLKSLLFGVSATDPLTFAVVPALLAGVALLACFIPARRATKVDPMVALRRE